MSLYLKVARRRVVLKCVHLWMEMSYLRLSSFGNIVCLHFQNANRLKRLLSILPMLGKCTTPHKSYKTSALRYCKRRSFHLVATRAATALPVGAYLLVLTVVFGVVAHVGASARTCCHLYIREYEAVRVVEHKHDFDVPCADRGSLYEVVSARHNKIVWKPMSLLRCNLW